ncbi:PREDICTED: uncharacterized protein LOC103924126 [Pygoscelis adeliae]|uniref:uncharacterized protein LOC103924126 n=1 Tax=Pygoscelis adeliae TaxID=9238 RepID=UPI0004F502CA|nr:PREDICTED: uncharacterized protein LOC103924126 [Pygoscelis adeliae]
MAPARRLLLLLLLLVALHARAAQAAPWRARGADEGGGNGYPASRLDVGLEPLGHPGGPLMADGFPTAWPIPVPEPESNPAAVPVGEGDPASQLGSRPEPPGDDMDVPVGRTLPAPWLDPALEPGWHPRGPPRAKDHSKRGKKSPEASEILKQILEQLEKGHGGSISLCLSRQTRQPEVLDARLDTLQPAQREGIDQSLAAATLGFTPCRRGGATEMVQSLCCQLWFKPSAGGSCCPRVTKTDREAVQKEAFWEGSRGSLPGSASHQHARSLCKASLPLLPESSGHTCKCARLEELFKQVPMLQEELNRQHNIRECEKEIDMWYCALTQAE